MNNSKVELNINCINAFDFFVKVKTMTNNNDVLNNILLNDKNKNKIIMQKKRFCC